MSNCLPVADSVPRPNACSDEPIRATWVEYLRRKDGCALCGLLSRLEYQHLVRFGTASMGNQESRQGFYTGLGLCNWHFWELRRVFWGPSLAETLFDVLRLMPADPSATGLALEAMPLHRGRCWVCRELACDETGYVRSLVTLLEDPAIRENYEESRGLCLPHVQVLSAVAGAEVHDWVLRAEGEHWKRLKHDLAELVRKTDPPLSWERTPSEDTAPARCIQKLVGSHGRPWPMEESGR